MVAVVQLAVSSTNGSVIKKRSVADDIRTGISLAGKIFGNLWPITCVCCLFIRISRHLCKGFDAASNVADLVARAFTNTNPNSNQNQQHNNGKRDESYANLEPFEDGPEVSQHPDHDTSGDINDSVIIDPPSGSQTTIGDSTIISSLLKVLGMDNSKLGALAVNGIIFIAQMVWQSETIRKRENFRTKRIF